MIRDPFDQGQGPPLWAVIAGLAAAALLTLGAAVGTSMLHQHDREPDRSPAASVARQ